MSGSQSALQGSSLDGSASLRPFIESMKIKFEKEIVDKPIVEEGFKPVERVLSEQERFISSLAALIMNVDPVEGRLDRGKIEELVHCIDQMVNAQVNAVIHHETFQELEATWRGLFDLIRDTDFKQNIMIDILDVSKEELMDDFQNNAVDFIGSAFFQKVYVSEYDQFGGRPFGAIIGLYPFTHTPADEFWLKMMGRVASASHAPFVGSVSPQFFGCESIHELAAVKDLEGLMNHPKYSSFNALRESEEAAYLGLCLPNYVLRLPWDPVKNPGGGTFNFTEDTVGTDDSNYLWGNSAILFAKNMIQSFTSSGWCQYIRGPKGGGLVSGLPVHTFNIRGEEEIKIPVEMVIPDYREFEFANSGFIPLIYRKGTGDACFFSAQSLKKPKKFKDPKDSENAQLVCNLAYTFSITRIAHYVKSIVRDNIGAAADAQYIQDVLTKWIMNYVTAVTNPDDSTLRRYPFKAAAVSVKEQPGKIGWYSCSISVLPHLQLEGVDVELRLESRLGKAGG